MANRKTCIWCRHGVQREMFAFYLHGSLCPTHKWVRNQLQREAKRGN